MASPSMALLAKNLTSGCSPEVAPHLALRTSALLNSQVEVNATTPYRVFESLRRISCCPKHDIWYAQPSTQTAVGEQPSVGHKQRALPEAQT